MRLSFRSPVTGAIMLGGTVALLGLLHNAAAGRGTSAERLTVPAPELVGGPWLNTPGAQPLRLADQRGKVVVLHFWTFG
jgi:hypothetical protein